MNQPTISETRASLARSLGTSGGRLAWVLALCVVLGLALEWANGSRLGPASGSQIMPVQQQISSEFYLTEPSFSEAENTKAKLQALATQFVTELRIRHDATALGADGSRVNPSYAVDSLEAMEELRHGIGEFKGTEQELVLVRELLCLLKKHGLADGWLDLYLNALYEHPTHPMIGRCAKEAAAMSEESGRQAELLRAFDLLERIPMEFSSKVQVREVTPRLTQSAPTQGAGRVARWLAMHVKETLE